MDEAKRVDKNGCEGFGGGSGRDEGAVGTVGHCCGQDSGATEGKAWVAVVRPPEVRIRVRARARVRPGSRTYAHLRRQKRMM